MAAIVTSSNGRESYVGWSERRRLESPRTCTRAGCCGPSIRARCWRVTAEAKISEGCLACAVVQRTRVVVGPESEVTGSAQSPGRDRSSLQAELYRDMSAMDSPVSLANTVALDGRPSGRCRRRRPWSRTELGQGSPRRLTPMGVGCEAARHGSQAQPPASSPGTSTACPWPRQAECIGRWVSR